MRDEYGSGYFKIVNKFKKLPNTKCIQGTSLGQSRGLTPCLRNLKSVNHLKRVFLRVKIYSMKFLTIDNIENIKTRSYLG